MLFGLEDGIFKNKEWNINSVVNQAKKPLKGFQFIFVVKSQSHVGFSFGPFLCRPNHGRAIKLTYQKMSKTKTKMDEISYYENKTWR